MSENVFAASIYTDDGELEEATVQLTQDTQDNALVALRVTGAFDDQPLEFTFGLYPRAAIGVALALLSHGVAARPADEEVRR